MCDTRLSLSPAPWDNQPRLSHTHPCRAAPPAAHTLLGGVQAPVLRPRHCLWAPTETWVGTPMACRSLGPTAQLMITKPRVGSRTFRKALWRPAVEESPAVRLWPCSGTCPGPPRAARLVKSFID